MNSLGDSYILVKLALITGLNPLLKVREGRRAADFPPLCDFRDNKAISKHI